MAFSGSCATFSYTTLLGQTLRVTCFQPMYGLAACILDASGPSLQGDPLLGEHMPMAAAVVELTRTGVRCLSFNQRLCQWTGLDRRTLLDRHAEDLSSLVDAGVVLDRKIRRGTSDFSEGPAMTRDEAVRSIEAGIEVVRSLAAETDVFGTGEMGIGNTSPSSAIVSVLSGMDVTPLVGRGAGLPESRLAHKAAVIRRGIEVNRPDRDDPLDVLAKVGGLEIGGIAGVILGAASLHRPVVVDGFISSAGALIAAALAPASRDYMILAHGSAEPGHVVMAKLLDKKPLLDLSMRLGEGSGAALAMHLLDAASRIMTRMATFESANVTTVGIR